LSLMRMASSRPARCETPPPATTARFCSARKRGVVFRVSTIRAGVPRDRSRRDAAPWPPRHPLQEVQGTRSTCSARGVPPPGGPRPGGGSPSAEVESSRGRPRPRRPGPRVRPDTARSALARRTPQAWAPGHVARVVGSLDSVLGRARRTSRGRPPQALPSPSGRRLGQLRVTTSKVMSSGMG
jgi:hypothetical protein